MFAIDAQKKTERIGSPLYGRRMILVAVLVSAFAVPSDAAVRQFGKETQKSPLWTGALDELVNSKDRVSGISTFGMTEFCFSGDSAVVNRVIEAYSKLEKAHLYLTTGDGDHRAALQIQHYGDHRNYLTVLIHDARDLSGLKLPPNVKVEALPSISEPIDPELKAARRELAEKVQETVSRYQAAQRPVK